ncbi:MAG: RNA polymerase sigma factor, partial [bacterium]|nr:RNA polymerase sigma factor [bacterium]
MTTERMRRLAAVLLGNTHDAEDVTQDVWCHALQGAETPRASDAWFCGVARNVARHHRRARRRQRRRERVAAKSEVRQPAQLALDHLDAARRLIEAVRSLPQPFRSSVVLQYLVGMTPADAAGAMGVNRATHRTRVHRGLELIRAELDRRDQQEHLRWHVVLAPLVSGGFPMAVGGVVVTKTPLAIGFALILLWAGAASLWMRSGSDSRPGPRAPQGTLSRSSDGGAHLQGRENE